MKNYLVLDKTDKLNIIDPKPIATDVTFVIKMK